MAHGIFKNSMARNVVMFKGQVRGGNCQSCEPTSPGILMRSIRGSHPDAMGGGGTSDISTIEADDCFVEAVVRHPTFPAP